MKRACIDLIPFTGNAVVYIFKAIWHTASIQFIFCMNINLLYCIRKFFIFNFKVAIIFVVFVLAIGCRVSQQAGNLSFGDIIPTDRLNRVISTGYDCSYLS